MKILLIGSYKNDKNESMERYTCLLKDELTKLGYNIREESPKPFFSKIIKLKNFKLLDYIDKFLIFPLKLRKISKWADIIHICDHSRAIYSIFVKKPVIITCHDLLDILSSMKKFKRNHVGVRSIILTKMTILGLKHSKKIICVSEKTRKDLLAATKLNPEKAVVINNCLNYNYARMGEDEAEKHLKYLGFNNKSNFFLHVGGNQWYKNRSGVIKIFSNLIKNKQMHNMKLVMVGKQFTKQMKLLIKNNNLHNKVVELNTIKNEELCALYSSAKALIFPSLQEGFGWPIIEAQVCGCPVFTSNRPPMTEVAWDSAIYFDPENNEKAAEIISNYIKKNDKLKELRRQGFENVKRFSTEKIINSYIDVYRETYRCNNQ